MKDDVLPAATATTLGGSSADHSRTKRLWSFGRAKGIL